jgi:hypothetical protein
MLSLTSMTTQKLKVSLEPETCTTEFNMIIKARLCNLQHLVQVRPLMTSSPLEMLFASKTYECCTVVEFA